MSTETDLKWHLNESKDKLGRIWSAVRDEIGIGRPPWTPGDVSTKRMFDLFVEMVGSKQRHYLFLPPYAPGPDGTLSPTTAAIPPIKFVDYVNVMPGSSYKRQTAEDRERIAKTAQEIKDFAETQGVEFVITKGDVS